MPFDADDLTRVAYEPRRGFLERSSLATACVGERRRALREAGEGAYVPRDAD